MSLRLAVIGGRGWLGRAVVEAARCQGVSVTALGRTTGPGTSDMDTIVDSADGRALARALDGVDVVINAAGDVSGDLAASELANVELPDRLGRLGAERGWRLVQLGSAAEYGPGASGQVPVAEQHPCEPASIYGASKLAGTEALLRWRTKGASVVVARVFNVVDGEMPPANPVRDLVDQVRRAAEFGSASDRPLIAVGDPTTERDLTPRADVACAVVALATRPAWPVDPVVNVCSGVATGFGDLAGTLGRRLDLDVEVVDLGWPRGGRIVGDPQLLRSLVTPPDPRGIDGLADVVLATSIPPPSLRSAR